jgi:lipoprotein-releasing system ATP-binding protein
MTALLEVRDLVKTFGKGDAATRDLRGLSLVLAVGEMAALPGPSGSGKSTLLTILGTLMKPTSGSQMMLRQDFVSAGDRELTGFRNLHIGFVFQFHNLLPDFTVLENVIFPTAVREGERHPRLVKEAEVCWYAWAWSRAFISPLPACQEGRSRGSPWHAP